MNDGDEDAQGNRHTEATLRPMKLFHTELKRS